jgi:hypothetical protein
MAPDTRGPMPHKHMPPPTHRVLQELKVYLGAWLRSPNSRPEWCGAEHVNMQTAAIPRPLQGICWPLRSFATKVLRGAEKKSRKCHHRKPKSLKLWTPLP